MTDKNREIEEFAYDLSDALVYFNRVTNFINWISTIENMLNKGYRKQSEGEWLPSPDGITPIKCSQCNAPALCATGVGAFGDFEITRHPSNFCPNCGARMKGDEGK